jgi:uncharacterized protein YaeQ
MAIGASIYKAKLTLSNFNDHFYHDFSLTMAKHPSENEERMMNRLVSFCLCADPELAFTKGLSTQEEPELGQPDDKRIRQAAGKSKKVTIFTTHPTTSEVWFDKIKDKVPQDRVQVIKLSIFENGPLDKLVTKTMDLNCTIEDDLLYIANDNERIGVKFTKL